MNQNDVITESDHDDKQLSMYELIWEHYVYGRIVDTPTPSNNLYYYEVDGFNAHTDNGLNRLTLFNAINKEVKVSINLPSAYELMESVCLSKDERNLVCDCGIEGSDIQIFDIKSHNPKLSAKISLTWYAFARMTSDGNTLAFMALQGSKSKGWPILLYNFDAAQQYDLMQEPREECWTSFDLSSNSELITAGTTGGGVYLRSLEKDSETIKLVDHGGGHKAEVTSIKFSPNGRFIASASTDGTVRIWDVEQKLQCSIINATTNKATSVAWKDSNIIACGTDLGETKFFRVSNGQPLYMLKPKNGASVKDISFTLNNQYVLIRHSDNFLRLWKSI